MTSAETPSLSGLWLGAVAREDICTAIEHVYQTATEEIARRGPACWASGRCCNFEAAGHRLYVTGLEAAYTIAKLPTVAGASPSAFQEHALRPLQLAEARSRGGCPFQIRNLCGVHTIKPLGCRVYFCDRSAQQWQQDLSERLLAEIRAIHDEFAIDYRYGEWRMMLELFL